jgi:hypothetical protein
MPYDETKMLDMLRAMYGGEYTGDELHVLLVAGQNSGLDPLFREIIPMRDPDTGLFYPYAASKSIVSQLEETIHQRGATCWFDMRYIVDPHERFALQLDPADTAVEVRLSDTLAQMEYRKLLADLRELGYPFEDCIRDIGPCPRPTVTVAVGRFLATEALEPKFRMTAADYAIKRGMRRAAELRMPMTGAARIGADLKPLSEIDALPAPERVPAAHTHEERARMLGRTDDDSLI